MSLGILRISSGLLCQSLPGPAVHNSHDDEEIIANLRTVPETLRQRPEMLHPGQDILHHDTCARQSPVDQLLPLGQGGVPPRFARRCHTVLRQVVMQAIETGIRQHVYLSGYPTQNPRKTEMTQIVHRSGRGRSHRSNQALFADDNPVLDRMPLPLARIKVPLPLRVPGPPNGLLHPVRDGEQVGGIGQHFHR